MEERVGRGKQRVEEDICRGTLKGIDRHKGTRRKMVIASQLGY